MRTGCTDAPDEGWGEPISDQVDIPPDGDDAAPGETAMPGPDRPAAPDPTGARAVGRVPEHLDPQSARPSVSVEPWVGAWTTALRADSHVPMSTAETKNFLRAMAASLTAAARHSTFDPAPVRSVGEQLVATHFVGPNALGITVGLLSEHLAATGAPPGRSAAILSALTSGYTTARTCAILEQQEALRQVWMRNSPAVPEAATSPRAAAFTTSTAALCLLDGTGRIVDPNPAWCDLFGVTTRECVGRRITDLLDTRDAGRVGEARGAVVAGLCTDATVDVRCWHPRGHALNVRLDLAPIPRPAAGGSDDEPGLLLATAYNTTPERDLAALMERQDERDGLTYLLNRPALLRRLGGLLEPPHSDIGLICLRVPHVDLVNRLDGQAAGDAVLCDTADLVQRTVGNTAPTARIGGAVFAVALPDAVPGEVSALVGTLQGVLGLRPGFVRPDAPLLPSVVGVHSPTHDIAPDALLDAAERLLRAARGADRTG